MRNLVLVHRNNDKIPDTITNMAYVLQASETIWVDTEFINGNDQEVLREIRSLLDEVYEKLDNLIEP